MEKFFVLEVGNMKHKSAFGAIFSECDTSQKKEIAESAAICGRVAVRGHFLRNFESAGLCEYPAKNKNMSRHVFIFGFALARVM